MSRPPLLIVDDEPRLLESLALILGRDYEVATASNGEEGLALLGSRSPALVLLDLVMPVMNGLTVLEQLRRSGSRAAVIIMTGGDHAELRQGCDPLGVQGYIDKPFDVDCLKRMIREILADRKGEWQDETIE